MEPVICPLCSRTDQGWHEPTSDCVGHFFGPVGVKPLTIVRIKCPHCREKISVEIGGIMCSYAIVE